METVFIPGIKVEFETTRRGLGFARRCVNCNTRFIASAKDFRVCNQCAYRPAA